MGLQKSGTTDKFTFYYQNKDHLGTVRETVTSTGAMKQRVNYYPFGGQLVDTLKAMVLSPNFQQYKYNGKEFDGTFGLNTYDYGARQHYPVLARWDRIDPHCEKYYGISPYAYCGNAPINRIDPDGMDEYYTPDGRFLFKDDKKTDNIIIRNVYNATMKEYTPWLVVDTPIENTVLSAEAYSMIFTHVLSQMEDVNVNEIHNKMVSVTVWEDNGNLKTTRDRYNDGGIDGRTLAETGVLENGDRVVGVYMYPNGYEEKNILNTVANIQNLLGAHEYLGHYKNGWANDFRVFGFQCKHKTWDKTTDNYKQYMYEIYNKKKK